MLHEEGYETEAIWQAVIDSDDPIERNRLIEELRKQIDIQVKGIGKKEDPILRRVIKYLLKAEAISEENGYKPTAEEIANLKLGAWNLVKFVAKETDYDVKAMLGEACDSMGLDREDYHIL